MRALSFAPRAEVIEGRRIRRATFEERSTLAVSAACVVANALGDVLSSAFGKPVELRLFEASVPSQRGWQAIGCDAILYCAPGIAVILRAKDAQAFARAVFGEAGGADRALSALELAALDRAVSALGPAFTAVLNGVQPELERAKALDRYTTYSDIQVESPACFRVGIALESDPAIAPRTTLGIAALLDVQLELAVRSAPVTMAAYEVAALALGQVLPMIGTKGAGFTLGLAGRPLACGECGVLGDRFALMIERLHNVEGSYAPSL